MSFKQDLSILKKNNNNNININNLSVSFFALRLNTNTSSEWSGNEEREEIDERVPLDTGIPEDLPHNAEKDIEEPLQGDADAAVKDTLKATISDEMLFGKTLGEKIKATKEISQPSKDFKVPSKTPQAKNSKNFKGPSRRYSPRWAPSPSGITLRRAGGSIQCRRRDQILTQFT